MPSLAGTFVTHNNTFSGRVDYNPDTGLIERVDTALGQADIVYDDNCLIFPGFIDIHVHAREDAGGSQNYKEDFASASLAALHGGVTHICDMPNNPVPPVTDAAYRRKEALTRKADVGVTLYGGIGPGTRPLSFTVPYKAYMGPSVGDLFFETPAQLEETIRHYEGRFVSFHVEDPALLKEHAQADTHEARRPVAAETIAMEFALYLIETYRLHGKICHLSTGDGLRQITAARARGVDVTCEVTPHHLFFDQAGLTEKNHLWLQMNPPLRPPADREALLAGLRSGAIDYLATDHAPHTRAEKKAGTSGVPLLDTYGHFAGWLIKERGVDAQTIARVCAYEPGRFVNHFTEQKMGQITPGYAASFTVLDMSTPTTITNEQVRSKAAWTPFAGMTLPVTVRQTIVNGRVYDPSEI